MNKTPPRGKPRFSQYPPKPTKNWEEMRELPTSFSAIQFGTQVADLQLLTQVTYNDIAYIYGQLERLDEFFETVNNINADINDPDTGLKKQVSDLQTDKLDKAKFDTILALKNKTFEDSPEITQGLKVIVDAFVNTLEAEGESNDASAETFARKIRTEKAKKIVAAQAEAKNNK